MKSNLWPEDIMKCAFNSILRGNVSIQAASGLFKIPNLTLQKRVEAAHLQKFQKHTIVVKSSPRPMGLCDKLKQLTIKVLAALYIMSIAQNASSQNAEF
jgi:hypothetical protein